MRELKEHQAYQLLTSKYEMVCLDYVILQCDEEYVGKDTHKKAVLCAFDILNERFADIDYHIDIEPEKMAAVKGDIEELLQPPTDPYYEMRPKQTRSHNIPSPLPYWYAFLETPYGTPYLKSDFTAFNEVLFSNRNDTEVYRWNDSFSNYFDAGKEWWGTGLWSVYDSKENVFIIIGASLTD